MDMDMDIDIDLDPEIARLQASTAALNALPSAMQADTNNTIADADAMVEDGEVAPSDAVAHKIHISGLSTLTTHDIARFASDNNKDHEDHVKIEWVDDHSANIVYSSDAAAAAALRAFSLTPIEDPLEPRRAQSLLTHPDIELYVRQALVTDVKVQGAAAQSTFYLRNPQYDPDLHPRSRGRGRGRGGNRGRGGGRNDYRHHGGGFEDDQMDRSRRSSGTEKGFSVDLYDDVKSDSAPTAPRAARRDSSYSSGDRNAGRRGGRNLERQSVDLIRERRDGRLRDRSASPTRDGDGRYGFSDTQPYRATARHRTPPPRPDNHAASRAIRQDLFAHKKAASALQNATKAQVELFPDRANDHPTSDLFPAKIKEKRQRELRPADITSAITHQRPRYNSGHNGGDLITHTSSKHGRLNDDSEDGVNWSIKGAGSRGSSSDFSFLGRAKAETRGGQKDLIDNRSGRSGQRLSRS
ncbi:uncharacterized protein RCC_06174 [Ramularia collo-cygni]|uniref:Uncharacterized protein n=1 Tax=Ramularia collo-cygni TaxID=112498 RepID=A0A2D3V0R9_9PEZI|nr:uncharacterized protein RCC_06174 [Ramularia collo-cygni]CZT20315.1 uncharacterized protein RCC_06174 [Ramularia collo-cygni]